MKAVVTKHGQERLKERLGVNKKSCSRVADLALERGLGRGETQGRLNAHLNSLYRTHKKGNNMKVYNRKVFLFHDNLLITVLPLDKKYNDDIVQQTMMKGSL